MLAPPKTHGSSTHSYGGTIPQFFRPLHPPLAVLPSAIPTAPASVSFSLLHTFFPILLTTASSVSATPAALVSLSISALITKRQDLLLSQKE